MLTESLRVELKTKVSEIQENESTLVKMCAYTIKFSSVQFSSVAQLCPTLCDPMNQHARPPCLLPSPGDHSNSRPSSR